MLTSFKPSWVAHQFLHALLAVLVVCSTTAATAQVARVEIHAIQASTLTDEEFLRGQKDGKPVTLAGELRIPRPGTDRLPAVVLLHGSGGIGGSVAGWEQYLNGLGVATFVVDSFTGRGIVSTIVDQSQLGRLTATVDAYRALDLLSKHPRIDPARIVLMGFSRGAQPALYAAMKRFQRMHGTAGREFAAYIPFYTPCGTTYRDDDDVTAKPIRLFHGIADDYNPIAACRAYVARLKAKGADVTLTEYAGAGHVFDEPALKKPLKLEKAQTTRQCELAEGPDGTIINAKSKLPFTYADSCVEYGPTIAFDENAFTESRKAVGEFLTNGLQP